MPALAIRQQDEPLASLWSAPRKALPEDMEALADVHARCMHRAFDGISREFSRMVSCQRSASSFIAQVMNDPEATAMVLPVGERIAGYAVAVKGNLQALGVMPDMRGQGAGRALLESMVAVCGRLVVRTPVQEAFFRRALMTDGREIEGMRRFEMGDQCFVGPRVTGRKFVINA